MGLVRLGVRPPRWVLLVAAGRVAAARALPPRRRHHVRREQRVHPVAVGAPVGHRADGYRLTTFVGPDRPGADPDAADGVATGHDCSLLSSGGTTGTQDGETCAARITPGRA